MFLHFLLFHESLTEIFIWLILSGSIIKSFYSFDKNCGTIETGQTQTRIIYYVQIIICKQFLSQHHHKGNELTLEIVTESLTLSGAAWGKFTSPYASKDEETPHNERPKW